MDDSKTKTWHVGLNSTANKRLKKLPVPVVDTLARLFSDLENLGPIQKDWPNFGALAASKRIPLNSYHCHIKKGRPTYVVCWQVVDKKIKIIEIFYVGSHEDAPY